jgi:nuclear pore complex protein Nup205
MTGLLKCVAIELKMTADKSQITQFGNLCKILLGIVQSQSQEAAPLEMSHYYSTSLSTSLLVNSTAGTTQPKKTRDTAKILLCKLLDCLDFEIKSLDKPSWDYFDSSLLQNLLQSCEVAAHPGAMKLIDIKKLHDVLKDELNAVQTTIAPGQRTHILQEIETILMYALQVNAQKSSCASTVKFLDAWGQVTEILFSTTSTLFVSLDTKQGLILEILQVLLNKVVPVQIMVC